MVCKDEVFMWFKSLNGSKRIELMCGLLNMCCPLELRFCCTCLEELASQDFSKLKDDETKSNNVDDIVKFSKDIRDPSARSNLIISLSLLHSSNKICSTALFKILEEEIQIEGLGSAFSDPKFRDEILLLLTLAQHHPAFSFDQQTFLAELAEAIENYCQQLYGNEGEESVPNICNLLSTINLMPPVFIPDARLCNTGQTNHINQDCESQQSSGQIMCLKVKAIYKKAYVRIRVSLGSNEVVDAYKTPYEIAVFHKNLLEMFPGEMKALINEKIHLPPALSMCGKQEVLNDSLIASISEYIWQINSFLPSHIMQSEYVLNFFKSTVRPGLSKSNLGSDNFRIEEPSKNSRLPSFTICHSQHVSNSSPRRVNHRTRMSSSKSENESIGQPDINASLPQSSSPLHSPSTSPYVSPSDSEINSRSTSPWTQQRELQNLSQEELECIGLHKEASSKLKKLLDNSRIVAPPNGLSSHLIGRTAFPLSQGGPVRNVMPMQNGNNISPICSDYSSPSESPSPNEIGNNSASSSSLEEVRLEKGTPSKSRFDIAKPPDELTDMGMQEPLTKSSPDGLTFVKSGKEMNSHHSPIPSVVPFPIGYTIPPLSPMQHQKPSFLLSNCRTNSAGMHMSPGGAILYDSSQFQRVPSALTFFSHVSPLTQRCLAPERVALSTATAGGMPITTLCPLPIMTSGSSTVPSPTCSFATNKSNSNVTMVTSSLPSSVNYGLRQHVPPNKGVAVINDGEVLSKPMPPHPAVMENAYGANCGGFLLTPCDQAMRPNATSACNCQCVPNSVRCSAPSPSPATTPQQPPVPTSMPYIGLPYLFHQSIPFIQAPSGTPQNGFIPPSAAIPTIGHNFYTLANGMTLNPELLYGGQAFTPQSPALSQATPTFITASTAQTYGNFPQPVTVSGMAVAHSVKVATCYNCGKVGHRGAECKEQNIEEILKPGKFQLNFVASKPVESNN